MRPSAPLPWQERAQALRGQAKCLLAAGSFGTGKTKWLCIQMVWDAHRFPGNVILTGRKKLSWFKASTLNDLLEAIPKALLLRHDKQNNDIYIRTTNPDRPSIIRYRQLDASRDAVNEIKSMNLGLFAPDQIEELDVTVVDAALGRLRNKGAARQLIGAANPRGRNWVWKRWIDEQGGEDYAYVEARMWRKDVPPPKCQADVTFETSDNPYLPWDYIRSLLLTYPKNWLDRYVYCGWDDFEGLIYPMYKDKTHLVQPFEIPDWWYRSIAYDYGHRNPAAIGWFAMSPDGDLYLYDLWSESGHWVESQAAILKAKCLRNGTEIGDVMSWPADPSIDNEQREVTIRDEFEEEGIYWDLANNDVSGGINRVAQYLTPNKDLTSRQYPNGKPKLFLFDIPEMAPMKEELKNYVWDDLQAEGVKNAPEKPKKINDHCVDMLRYEINEIEDSVKPEDYKEPNWLKNMNQASPSGLSYMSA